MQKNKLISDVQLKYTRTDILAFKVRNSKDIANLCYQYLPADQIALREHFGILLLNRAHRVLGIATLSTGGIDTTVVDVRHVMANVILANSCAIVLFHNHPSGNLVPSPEDVSITRRITEACNIFNVAVLDHVILSGIPGEQRFFSFADGGRL